MTSTTNRLAEQIHQMVIGDDIVSTQVHGLFVYRARTATARTQIVYQPSLCVVAQGQKVAHIGKTAHHYDSRRFFFSALPLPAEVEVTKASQSTPVLGLILELSLEDLARVSLEMREHGPSPRDEGSAPSPTFTGQVDTGLADALRRLLASTTTPMSRHMLYDATLREVLYLLLAGASGPSLRAVALQRNNATSAIIKVARFIDRNFDRPLRVPELARLARMSESSFYQGFRSVTALSPVQYQKRIRLQKARVMIAGGTRVTQAAHAVGYSSSSQFSKEFRALFGHSPSRRA